MALISRDPFARTELHRTFVRPTGDETCDNCGGLNGRGGLFEYHTETDGGRTYPHRGLFCSKSCHDSYHL